MSEIWVIMLTTAFFFYCLATLMAGNYMPIQVVLHIAWLIFWLRRVHDLIASTNYFSQDNNAIKINKVRRGIEFVRVTAYFLVFMFIFPYDLHIYNTFHSLMLRISSIGAISLFTNILKLLACKSKSKHIGKFYLWSFPLREIISFSITDLFFLLLINFLLWFLQFK